jgi:hypothetical protein
MKTQIQLVLIILSVSIIGCEKYTPDKFNIDQEDSFLPMNIGNYWRMNSENYIEIVDTIWIEGNLFYKFSSLTGGDAIGVQYLRIDDNNNLIEKYPTKLEWTYVHAKFNSEIGDKFYTLNDKTINDYEVMVKFKNNDTIKFEFDMVYHPNLKGDKFIVAYKRGFGFIDNWKEIRINNRIYRY